MFTKGKFCSVNLKNSFFILFVKYISSKSPAPKFTTEDTSPTFKAFEEGSETMSKEANTQLALRQEKFIRDLKNALVRIENKTYGVCRVTGKLIQKQRLILVPHATLSIEAKNMQK